MNGRLPIKRAKWNGNKQIARYRIQRNSYKELTDDYKEMSENDNNTKKEIETINKNQE